MNADGAERLASDLSAKDVMGAIKNFYHPILLRLNKDKWPRQIQVIDKESVCILVTHGDFGENGSLQKILEINKIAHTHSPSTVCSILLNKHLTKMFYISLGISTPPWYFNGNTYGVSHDNFLSGNLVKKPLLGGSKIGISKVSTISYKAKHKYIYEKYINGFIQISVSILGSKDNILSLTPTIRPRPLFNNTQNKIKKIKISKEIINKCQIWGESIHLSLGCRGVTKTDFLLDQHNKIWAIETDAIPGLSKMNAVSVGAEESGINYKQLINKILQDAYVE